MIFISAYAGLNFTYAGQASQNHDLRIVSFDASAIRFAGGSSMNLITDKAPRSLRYDLLDATPGDPLEFDLEIVSIAKTMHPRIFTTVKAWLCGQLTFQPLVIQHPDFEDMHFNCILNNPEDIVAHGYHGIKVTATCDAGGAWHNARKKNFAVAGGSHFHINNQSHDNDYVYPRVEFVMDDSDFSITNKTDNNRTMTFSGLTPGEIITIEETGEIVSSLGIHRISNFNKKYFRLLRGVNMIECAPGATTFSITMNDFIRIGG